MRILDDLDPNIIDKSEVRRYLGYGTKRADAHTEEMIGICAELLCCAVRPRYMYKIFPIKAEERDGTKLVCPVGTTLCLSGNDIYDHLKNAEKVALMAATLGIEADNLIRLAQSGDMLKAVVLDACAGELIEKVCDAAESEIREKATSFGYGINYRFSPGYGDLPIETQSELLRVLDTSRRMGLTLTESCMMVPGKSVSAIIGIGHNFGADPKHRGCDSCSMRDTCRFRKDGTTCGN